MTAHKSDNIRKEISRIDRAEREQRNGHPAATLWLTGLSGSGKSTLANQLERRLFDLNKPVFWLDGDNVRFGLNRDLGFAHEDRTENIRRIAEVAALFNSAGHIVVASFISPYRKDRQSAMEIIGRDRFYQIYLNTPLAVCEDRDAKGLYAKARAGEIQEFTGINAPYEPPENPALTLDTSESSVLECVNQMTRLLGIDDELESGSGI